MKVHGSAASFAGALLVGCLAVLFNGADAAFDITYNVVNTFIGVNPRGGFYNSTENKLSVTDNSPSDGRRIRIIQNGAVRFIADPVMSSTYDMWVDPEGYSYIIDWDRHNVMKASPDGQTFVHFAGVAGCYSCSSVNGGDASSVAIRAPSAITGDTNGNVYIAQGWNGNRVRKVNKSDGKMWIVAGNGLSSSVPEGDGGSAINARVSAPMGVAVATTGEMFISTNGDSCVRWVSSTGIINTLAGSGTEVVTEAGVLTANSKLSGPQNIWMDSKGNIFLIESVARRLLVIAKENNYEKIYVVKSGYSISPPVAVFGDDANGMLFVTYYNQIIAYQDSRFSQSPSASPSVQPTAPTASPSVKPTAAPTTLKPTSQPSVKPTLEPTSSKPTVAPSAAPSQAPSLAPTLAVPEYTLAVSAKSFKYFEVRVFTEANERVFPVSYNLVDCPENAGAVIWGHESTPVTENTNTCVYGLPRHYWCECPALVNGNKPKLTLNFGGTVFDRVELLILDWVDGEVKVSDSANNIVLFSASRAGGPLAGEEFVGYDHLNLLQVAPSVVPTIVPSSVPTTKPSWAPTNKPSIPSVVPTQTPTVAPTTTVPSAVPSVVPSMVPSAAPSFTAQYTITLTAKTFKYFEVRVYTHDNLRIFPVSYELEHCPENAGVTVWNDQTTEDTNTCVYGYPRNFWCQCAAVADVKPKLVLHMGHTVFDRVELLLLNWEDGEVTVTDEANHETFLSATHDGVGNEFVTFNNLNLEHAAAPARRLLRGA